MVIEKRYCFGGVVFQILSPVPLREDARFETFAADESLPVDYCFEVFERPPEQREYVTTCREGNRIRVYIDTSKLGQGSVALFLISANAAALLPEKDAFLLHASYVYHDGQAILFTAPSETGKSTQAHYWESVKGAEVVNEDRVIVGCRDGVWYAHGCWATGTAKLTKNISAPLRAVVLLGQGKENRVYSPAPTEAFRRLIPQCSFDDGSAAGQARIIDLVSRLINSAPLVGYDCIHDPSAVEDLEKHI